MKTQSQHIADMIARGEPWDDKEASFCFWSEVIASCVILVMFVFFMGLILYVGTAAGY